MSLLASFNLTQHVIILTHTHGHTLDLVITSASTSLNPIISHAVNTTSDDFPIFSQCHITLNHPTPQTTVAFRRINSISMSDFIYDLNASQLITDPSFILPEFIFFYFSALRSLLDKHAPSFTKTSTTIE